MPMACVPAQISGRNRVWRRIIIDAIRTDPEWNHGDYTAQPRSLCTALAMMYLMSSNPARRLTESPTLATADEALDRYTQERLLSADPIQPAETTTYERILAEEPRRAIGQPRSDPGLTVRAGDRLWFVKGQDLYSASLADGLTPSTS